MQSSAPTQPPPAPFLPPIALLSLTTIGHPNSCQTALYLSWPLDKKPHSCCAPPATSLMSFSSSASLLALSSIPPTCQVASDLRTLHMVCPSPACPSLALPTAPSHQVSVTSPDRIPEPPCLCPLQLLSCSVILLMAPSIISLLCRMFLTRQPVRPLRAGLAPPGSPLCPSTPHASRPASRAFLGTWAAVPALPAPQVLPHRGVWAPLL